MRMCIYLDRIKIFIRWNSRGVTKTHSDQGIWSTLGLRRTHQVLLNTFTSGQTKKKVLRYRARQVVNK